MENSQRERTCPPSAGYYTWQQGDTLVGVAQRYGLTTSAIRQANAGLPLETVAPGTRICLPSRPVSCPSGRLYTVRRGDTLVGIARQNGVTVAQLMDQNPYVDPDDLQVGQVLCLPDRVAPPAPGPTPGPNCPAGYTQGTVRYGENIVELLTRYNMSYAVFTRVNPQLNPNQLAPGQRYCVPPRSQRGGCGQGRSYLIQDGENLQGAARANGVTPARLLILNPNLSPGDFVPGRMICLP